MCVQQWLFKKWILLCKYIGFKFVHNFYLENFQTLTNVQLEVCVMRMRSVWTHMAVMCVPATLATLEMGTHVWTLMSV